MQVLCSYLNKLIVGGGDLYLSTIIYNERSQTIHVHETVFLHTVNVF